MVGTVILMLANNVQNFITRITCTFSLLPGDLSAQSGPANNSSDEEPDISISLPPSLFQQLSNDSFTLLFSMFESSVLLPQANESRSTFAVASTVVGATVANHDIAGLDDNITVTLRLGYPVS